MSSGTGGTYYHHKAIIGMRDTHLVGGCKVSLADLWVIGLVVNKRKRGCINT